ncbi:MAG: hypothetical protein WA667_18100, partial [Candidatus Nitrosopolaris sp.]
KRSWILQAIKRFGDYYYRKYNNREVVQLIREIIERYDLNRDLDMKDRIYLVSPQFVEEKVNKIFDLIFHLIFHYSHTPLKKWFIVLYLFFGLVDALRILLINVRF